MATKKAGKRQVKKPVARRSAPRKAAPKHVAPAAKVELTFPCNVVVKKGGERLPVTVKDAAHHAQLVDQFGESAVEVQS